ncbi:MAG TPA: HEAT repeat domain-containing protein [Polyangiaceae bacterium]|nr:HEAT repeat domain-containing protein [Polyangiaceae bacterium]
MGKLSSAIVQRKLASLRDVEEALARQVLYGGDLATNLLEQAPGVDERALVDLLSEVNGLPATSPGVIPPSPAEARMLVPGDVALRHTLYPLEQNAGSLVVAVAEPLSAEVEQDLSFGLGVTLSQRIAPFVRIRQAIGRDYGVPLDRRSVRVLAKLEGLPDPSPSVAPSPLAAAPDFAAMPRPPTMPPIGLPTPMDMLSPLYPASAPAERAAPPPVAPVQSAPAASAPAELTPEPALQLPPVVAKPVVPVAILPISSVGPTPVISIPEPSPSPAESIHERLTSPAPPVAPARDEETAPWPGLVPNALPTGVENALPTGIVEERVTAPAPASTRKPGSGQHAIALRDLASWSAENREAEKKRGRGRRRGPYTAAAAEQDLMSAEGRDDVLSAFFDFASQYFEYAALFAVHGDLAEGRDASGPGADRAAVTGIGVPLDLPSALRTVRNDQRFAILPLAEEGLDGRLAKDLGRTHGKKALLLPILVRERCVLVFYGDDGENDVELQDVGDVIAFAPLVAVALENLILRRKTGLRKAAAENAEGRPPSVRPPPRTRAPLPTREERVEALSGALQSTVRPVVETDGPRRAMTPPPMAAVELPSPPVAPRASTPAQGTPARASNPPPPPEGFTPKSKAPSPDGTPAQGTPTRASNPPPPPDAALAFPLFPKTDAAPPASALPVRPERPKTESGKTNPEIPRPSLRRPIAEAPPLSTRTEPKPPERPDDSPEISVGTAEVDWADGDEEEGIPNSQIVAPPQLPIKRYRSEELRLPSVIVNVDQDVHGLLARALEGDDDAVDRLGGLGASAASLLIAKFPGPIKPDSDRLGAPAPASTRGPVLRALAKMGNAALPFVVARSSDSDPAVRALATLLLGEMPSEESAQAVARRVMDSAAEVRRAALEAGRLLQPHEEARTLLRDRVCSIAEEPTADVEARVAAIEALSHFRDTRTVPRLVRLVPKNDEVGQSAQWALSVITRQAFGRDTAAWDAWWTENQDKHRIVWLIDALMHDDPEIRRAAGEELKALTKEYFGYYDDLSKSERQKAQKRYREWWEATGKARFTS